MRARNWLYYANQLFALSAVTFGLLTTLLLSTVVAQTWQFGENGPSLIRSQGLPAASLQVRAGGRAALGSYAFVARVGGVSLEAVAIFPDGLNPAVMSLEYDARRPDGQRATLRHDSAVFNLPLYDWQLRPIALFADTEFAAVVSLFGSGPDRARNFYIEYHPAFTDTLMGLRLLHADIILIDPEQMWDLPRNESGIQVVGPGERALAAPAAKTARAAIQRLMRSHDAHSWVLTDVDRIARVWLRDGVVRIDLQPYYYFWRSERDITAAERERYEQIRVRLRLAQQLNRPTASIAEELERLIGEIDQREPRVVPVDALTSQLDSERRWLEDLNSTVFDAVRVTAQYAAFFRAFRARNPEGWRSFLAGLPPSAGPAVQTPNVWPRSVVRQ